jgi:predicted nucleic acid-binding protein
MKLIVDTNILISSMINPAGKTIKRVLANQ